MINLIALNRDNVISCAWRQKIDSFVSFFFPIESSPSLMFPFLIIYFRPVMGPTVSLLPREPCLFFDTKPLHSQVIIRRLLPIPAGKWTHAADLTCFNDVLIAVMSCH